MLFGIELERPFFFLERLWDIQRPEIRKREARVARAVGRKPFDQRTVILDRLGVVARNRNVIGAERPITFAFRHPVQQGQRFLPELLRISLAAHACRGDRRTGVRASEARVLLNRSQICRERLVAPAREEQILRQRVGFDRLRRTRGERLGRGQARAFRRGIAEGSADSCPERADRLEHLLAA